MREVTTITSDREYFAHEAINASRLKQWLKSPEHFFDYKPKEQTEAMRIGSAFHAVMLGQKFKNMGERLNWRSKDGKEQKALVDDHFVLNPDIPYLFEHELSQFEDMLSAVMNHPAAKIWMSKEDAVNELGIVWTHESGVKLKIKPDKYYLNDKGDAVLIDIKTCDDASEYGFLKACRSFHYPLSDALYRKGVEAYTGKKCSPMYFIMIEKEAPHYVGVYRVADYQYELIDRWIDMVLPEIQSYAYEEGKSPYLNKKQSHGIHVTELPDYYTDKFLTI